MSDAYWMYQHVIGSIGAAKPARAERQTNGEHTESLYVVLQAADPKFPLSDLSSSLLGRPFKEIAAATVESNLSFGSSVDLKLSWCSCIVRPQCTMRHFSFFTVTSIITNPCLLSLMGVILLTIGNATAVGAQDVHLEPHGNDQNGRPPPLPHETKHPAEDTGYRRRARPIPPREVVNIYISNLDYHTRLPTPQSVIALGNDPNDFARSGRLFRKRDPFNQLKKRRELDWRFAAISHNVDTLNVLLLYIRTKEVVSNFHFCAAVLNHFDEGGYLYEKTDWLEQFLHLYVNPRVPWSGSIPAPRRHSIAATSGHLDIPQRLSPPCLSPPCPRLLLHPHPEAPTRPESPPPPYTEHDRAAS
ncbi:hypothetical protein F5880DRAFT_1706204 [Lentinula raphanica]|nr:hypothetical protein F5880DRAFT_1706204 [Lentinula raphanica]